VLGSGSWQGPGSEREGRQEVVGQRGWSLRTTWKQSQEKALISNLECRHSLLVVIEQDHHSELTCWRFRVRSHFHRRHQQRFGQSQQAYQAASVDP